MPQPFNNAVMTRDGAKLLTKAQAGEVKIKLTRIVIGNGVYSAEEKTFQMLQEQKELKSPKNSYPLSDIEVYSEHSVKITALITNKDIITGETLIDEGYFINEMGLFAKPEDGDDSTEILYSITVTSGENGDFMPPYNGYNPAQITQEYFATVSNTADVTINYVGAVATAEEVLNLKKQTNAIIDNLVYKAIGIPTAPQTLVAGTTEVIFTVDNINDNSTIRVEVADISTLSHRGIIVNGNNVTVKFEPQENDILVRLVVFNELEETDF